MGVTNFHDMFFEPHTARDAFALTVRAQVRNLTVSPHWTREGAFEQCVSWRLPPDTDIESEEWWIERNQLLDDLMRDLDVTLTAATTGQFLVGPEDASNDEGEG